MKILIIHTSAGAGHTKAAEAVFRKINKSTPFDAVLVDSLDYTSPLYKKIYRGIYSYMVTHYPSVWGFFFALTDVPILRPLVRLVRRVSHMINGHKLEKFLTEENFDYIVSTHFFPNEVLGHLKERKLISSKVIAVVTDFDVHSIWLAKGIDLYCAASEFTRQKMLSFGIPEDRIKVTGIPTDEKFLGPFDKIALRKKLGLKVEAFTVLVATGSFGMGPIEEILKSLNEFQVIVVCGHNKNLYKKLTDLNLEYVKVYGLVDNMDVLMAMSDAMFTKPGGLSISEALVRNLPMFFFSAIPGQETNNIKVLKKYGIGTSDCSISQMIAEIQKFDVSPDDFMAAQKLTQKLAKPSAVSDIVRLIS